LDQFRVVITNLEKLQDLFVFDQWIFNEDRRTDHVKLGTDQKDSTKLCVYGIDHGHTLNGYKGGKWTEASFTEDVARTISPVQFDPGIARLSETKSVRDLVKNVRNESISGVVDQSVLSVCELQLNQDEMTEVESNAVLTKRILRMRRESIDRVVSGWCQQVGKVVD